MPELPEVETTRRGLLKSIRGERVAELVLHRADLRFPLPTDLAERVEGRTITDIRRRAKYLLIDLDSGESILAHLGMSGSFRVLNTAEYAPKKHDHALFYLENGTICVFHDPRRFGLIDIIGRGEEKTHKLLKMLGPEPLSEDFSPAYLAQRLKNRKGPIKPVLMDQKLVVGVGNIYASESLYLCGIHPEMPAEKAAQFAPAMIAAIRTTLSAAIDSGGSTLRDYIGADGTGGYFQHRFNVYERDGEDCFRCKSSIEIATHAGRSTYWCPKCQGKQKNVKKR